MRAVLLFLAGFVAGCFLPGVHPARAVALELEVRHTFHGEPLLLDSLRYRNAAGETLSFERLSYLLGGFALEREGGGWIELTDQFAWIDAARHRTSVRLGGIPSGHYRALRFHVGPDAATNAADPARWPAEHPLNPNLNGLYWGWQGGYVFLAVEGHFRPSAPGASAGLLGFAYHLARDPFCTQVALITPLDLGQDGGVLVDFDLAALLDGVRPLVLSRDGTATHSREGDPVATALAANLAGAFHARQFTPVTPAAMPPVPSRPLYLPTEFTPYRMVINRSWPIPTLPRDNPLTEERVALGKRLFHERALSRDDSISCASCHQESAGMSDPRRFSVGVAGRTGSRRAMGLFDLAWKNSFFWDGRAESLRAQVRSPIEDHAEMDETLENVVAKLGGEPTYAPLFRAAFGSPEITTEKLGLALEDYLLTLTSPPTKFDRVLAGQEQFTDAERRGVELFMTEFEPRTGQRGADCFHCHGGPLFTDHQFHNNGLSAPGDDPGRFRVTALEVDRGKFATPSLRNVARRAPYMHDGRFETLDDVVAHYDHGVTRSPTLDPNLAKHPESGLHLSADDRRAIVAFLKTL